MIVDDKKEVSKIFESAKRFGHKCFFVHLEDGVDDATGIAPRNVESDDVMKFRDPLKVNQFNTILASIGDATSRNFFVQCLKKRILLECAKALECSKVFSPECSNDLAVTIIAGESSTNVDGQKLGIFVEHLSWLKEVKNDIGTLELIHT